MFQCLYVGLDDTDTLETPGTNKLALHLCKELVPWLDAKLVTRHQLLEDPRVPCTNKNGCAAIKFEITGPVSNEELISRLSNIITDWCPVGSDPGLCVADEASAEELVGFGQNCQRQLLTQSDAHQRAAEAGCVLRGLGGTNDGVIGALAAVGLQHGGNDGRVIYAGRSFGDLCDLTGIWSVGQLRARGISSVVQLDSGFAINDGTIELGKRLRANYRSQRLVLYVEKSDSGLADWTAVRVT